MARKRRSYETMDIAWVSVTDGGASTVNAMAKLEALNQLCLRRWMEKHADGRDFGPKSRNRPNLTKVREDEVIGVLPIEVQHVHAHHFRVLCVCGSDAAAIIRAVAVACPGNGRVVSKHLSEAFSISVASACDHNENLSCAESFAVPDLTTKESGAGNNFNGGQTVAGVRRRLAHRVLHAAIILHDAFWTLHVNDTNVHRPWDAPIPPFLVYQNRCRSSAELADGPGFDCVGKSMAEKIAKSAGHWERVWQRRPTHVPLGAAAARGGRGAALAGKRR